MKQFSCALIGGEPHSDFCNMLNHHWDSQFGNTRKSNKTESNYIERGKQSGQSVGEISSLVADHSTNLSNRLDCLEHEARVWIRGESLDMNRESRT